METYYQWLIEWVWVPVTVVMWAGFKQLFKLRADVDKLMEQDARRTDLFETSVRNIEGAVMEVRERMASMEGYIEGSERKKN